MKPMDLMEALGDLPEEDIAELLTYEAPPSPVDCLRPYQDRGYQWLMSLHALGMGGILADDMGLGKTVQMLSALLASVKANQERKPSIIISPTSLTYNWLSECEKFTPQLSVLLLSGGEASAAFVVVYSTQTSDLLHEFENSCLNWQKRRIYGHISKHERALFRGLRIDFFCFSDYNSEKRYRRRPAI